MATTQAVLPKHENIGIKLVLYYLFFMLKLNYYIILTLK